MTARSAASMTSRAANAAGDASCVLGFPFLVVATGIVGLWVQDGARLSSCADKLVRSRQQVEITRCPSCLSLRRQLTSAHQGVVPKHTRQEVWVLVLGVLPVVDLSRQK